VTSGEFPDQPTPGCGCASPTTQGGMRACATSRQQPGITEAAPTGIVTTWPKPVATCVEAERRSRETGLQMPGPNSSAAMNPTSQGKPATSGRRFLAPPCPGQRGETRADQRNLLRPIRTPRTQQTLLMSPERRLRMGRTTAKPRTRGGLERTGSGCRFDVAGEVQAPRPVPERR